MLVANVGSLSSAMPGYSQFLSGLVMFALGLLAPSVAKSIAAAIESHQERFGLRQRQIKRSVYGLQHGILNIDLPPKAMWMNLGYWKGSHGDFTKACTQLLEEVLLVARVTERRDGVTSLCRPLDVVDVGFGCGDQSLYLAQLNRDDGSHRLISYTGITKDEEQFDFAVQRFERHGLIAKDHATRPGSQSDFRVYCADAADPGKWDPDLRASLKSVSKQASLAGSDKWLLGLDTLYHFYPSRAKIFEFASRELGASIMAFDLAFPDGKKPGILNSMLLRLFCIMTSTPYGNLLSTTDYRAQLAALDYDEVTMTDISEHVFDPLVEFLDGRHLQLQMIGKGLGSLRIASWVFKWWSHQKLISAFIIVARKSQMTKP